MVPNLRVTTTRRLLISHGAGFAKDTDKRLDVERKKHRNRSPGEAWGSGGNAGDTIVE